VDQTAVGARHICLRRVEPKRVFELTRQEHVTMLCAAPTVLIGLASACRRSRRGADGRPRGDRWRTAAAPSVAEDELVG
jgi:fatty-acyl-CoA synthase